MVDTNPKDLGDVNKTDNNANSPLIDVKDTTTMTLVTIGCLVGIFLLVVICVIIMFLNSRRKPRRALDYFMYEVTDDNSTCKSAPISRKNSPMMEKRRSCPNAYGAIEDAMIKSSATADQIPQLLLTPERVQPAAHDEKSKSTSALEYQKSFLGALPYSICKSDTIVGQAEYDTPAAPSVQGRVWFTVMYDVIVQQLVITLIKVNELPGRGLEENTRDAFVKVFLLPEEQNSRTSKTIKKTLNPVFNETFMFQVKEDDVNGRSIRFSVYDVDRRRLRHSLGHVVVSLCDVNTHSSAILWRDLESDLHNSTSAGDINIGLSYLPQIEKMKVIILRVRNLHHKFNSDAGLFVRLQFSYGNKLGKTKHTLTQRAGSETNFNESFSFSTSSKNIDNFNFNISLMQTARGSSTDAAVEVGHVNLGSFMFARGAGLLHWQEMLSRTRSIVTKWHHLNVQL